jgi:hypothetical protein
VLLDLGFEALPGIGIQVSMAAAGGMLAAGPIDPVQQIILVNHLQIHLLQLDEQIPTPLFDVPAGRAHTDGSQVAGLDLAYPDHGSPLGYSELPRFVPIA